MADETSNNAAQPAQVQQAPAVAPAQQEPAPAATQQAPASVQSAITGENAGGNADDGSSNSGARGGRGGRGRGRGRGCGRGAGARHCTTCNNILGPADHHKCGNCRVKQQAADRAPRSAPTMAPPAKEAVVQGAAQAAQVPVGGGGDAGFGAMPFGGAGGYGGGYGGGGYGGFGGFGGAPFGAYGGLTAQAERQERQDRLDKLERDERRDRLDRQDRQDRLDRQERRERDEKIDREEKREREKKEDLKLEREREDKKEAARRRERSPEPRRAASYRQRSPMRRQGPGALDHLNAPRGRRVAVPCRNCDANGSTSAANHFYHECRHLSSVTRRQARLRFERSQQQQTAPFPPAPQQPVAPPQHLLSGPDPASGSTPAVTPVVSNIPPAREPESALSLGLYDNLERFARGPAQAGRTRLEVATAYRAVMWADQLTSFTTGHSVETRAELFKWLNAYIIHLQGRGQ
ncbi:hypothetical protein LTR08_002648 [Meristemomyces frigidus]|nr:hypothetical protein LTR08_002648 [Meristemomyces frigidus]